MHLENQQEVTAAVGWVVQTRVGVVDREETSLGVGERFKEEMGRC